MVPVWPCGDCRGALTFITSISKGGRLMTIRLYPLVLLWFFSSWAPWRPPPPCSSLSSPPPSYNVCAFNTQALECVYRPMWTQRRGKGVMLAVSVLKGCFWAPVSCPRHRKNATLGKERRSRGGKDLEKKTTTAMKEQIAFTLISY